MFCEILCEIYNDKKRSCCRVFVFVLVFFRNDCCFYSSRNVLIVFARCIPSGQHSDPVVNAWSSAAHGAVISATKINGRWGGREADLASDVDLGKGKDSQGVFDKAKSMRRNKFDFFWRSTRIQYLEHVRLRICVDIIA